MVIDPRHLVQLYTIVELGSFAAAAERLNLTQPALSRNIRLLEDRVGTKLLERGRHGAVPTEVGAMLSAQGRSLREILQRANQTADSVRAGDVGQIRLGTTFGVANDLLTEPIARYLQRLPGTSIRMSVGPTPLLLDRLKTGELDLVIGGTQFVGERQGIRIVPLFDNRLVVLARAGHPLAGGAVVRLEQLRQARWIVRPALDPLQTDVASAMTRMGLSAENLAFETASSALAVSVMMSSDLLMLEPYASAKYYVQAGQITEVPVPLRMKLRQIGVAWRDDPLIGPTIRTFVTIARIWAEERFGAVPASAHEKVPS